MQSMNFGKTFGRMRHLLPSLHRPKIPKGRLFSLTADLSPLESIGVLPLAACILGFAWAISLRSQLYTATDPPAVAREKTARAIPLLASAESSSQPKRMLRNSSMSLPPVVPRGMVHIAGGEFSMGSDDAMFANAQPWHRVYVDAF